MKNEKGSASILVLVASHGFAVSSVIAFKIAFAAVALAAIWHIPAWEEAKKNHTEEIYQAQQMWPQQFFNKISNTEIAYKYGNGGNF